MDIDIKGMGVLPFMGVLPHLTRHNTELNDLNIIICLRKPEVTVKEFQFVIALKKPWSVHCLSCSYINDVIDLLP